MGKGGGGEVIAIVAGTGGSGRKPPFETETRRRDWIVKRRITLNVKKKVFEDRW